MARKNADVENGETGDEWPKTLPKWPHGQPVVWSVVRSGVDTYLDFGRLRIAIGHRLNRLAEIRLANRVGTFFNAYYAEGGTLRSAREAIDVPADAVFPQRWVESFETLYGEKGKAASKVYAEMDGARRAEAYLVAIAARRPKGEKEVVFPNPSQLEQAREWTAQPGDVPVSSIEERLRNVFARLMEQERYIAAYTGSAAMEDPTGIWLKGIRGIGPVLSAALLATFDCRRAKHVSSYWAYAGLGPGIRVGPRTGKERRMDRPVEGELNIHNAAAKVLAWKVVTSLMMTKNLHYRAVYEEAKRKYLARPDIVGTEDAPIRGGVGHADMMAKRVMAKEFLKDFYLRQRADHGLSVDGPYDPHAPGRRPEPVGAPLGTPMPRSRSSVSVEAAE